MDTVKRFGVSLEKELLEKLDKLVDRHGFPNRSQAIRFLIQDSLIEDAWQGNESVGGCLVVVYDHHKRDLLSRSMDVQHEYHHLILSVQHVHLDHHNCMETIILKGKASQLRELADKIIALKGIQHGKLVMTG